MTVIPAKAGIHESRGGGGASIQGGRERGGRSIPTSSWPSTPGAARPRWPHSARDTPPVRSWCSCPAPTSTASSTATPRRPWRRWPARTGSWVCTTSWRTTCPPGSGRSSGSFTSPRCPCAPPARPCDAPSTSASSGTCARRRIRFGPRVRRALAPAASKLRVIHLGKPHDAAHEREARAEMAANPRYVWRGEVPRWQVRRTFAHCHAMVMSSIMEGGANVVSEAVVARVPVIASDIPGNVGLLGAGHPPSILPETPSAPCPAPPRRDRIRLPGRGARPRRCAAAPVRTGTRTRGPGAHCSANW